MDFITKFEKKLIPEPMSGCWLWTGAVHSQGYGQFRFRSKTCLAHRVAWELYKGPLAPSEDVLHRCDTPACVNPGHLFLGDHFTNMQDAVSKKRLWQQRVTHCPVGHAYDEENTRYFGNRRSCITCTRERDRIRYRLKQKQANLT